MIYGQKISPSTVTPGTPSPADLALINKFSLVPQTADSVACFSMIVSSDNLDRDGDRMTPEILEDFAASLPGKACLLAHNWSGPGPGLFYKSELVTDPDGSVFLYGSAYFPKRASADIIQQILDGTARFVSIGFYAPLHVETSDPTTGQRFMEFRRGTDGTPGESLEASICFLGSNPDAQIIKHAQTTMTKSFQQRTQRRSKFGWLIPRTA